MDISISVYQLYIFVVIILVVGIVFGCLITRAGYKDKYGKDLELFRNALEKERAEKEKIQAEQKRAIAHAVTQEWNRGYSAAFDRLKNEFLYISQWEKEHDMNPGEIESLAENEED